jgi:hypothetical protein
MDADREDQVKRAREILQRAGRLDTGMTDDEVVTAAGELMRERIPAPAVPAGTPIISGRAWLSDALTAGGFRAPEDRRQRADLGDGGPDVDLGILAVLVMRHRSGGRPADWDNAGLVAKFPGSTIEEFERGQRLLDGVAADLGVPARPEPRWWEKPPAQ